MTSPRTSLRNLTRWQQVDQFSLVDQPQGTWCVETRRQSVDGCGLRRAGHLLPNRGGTVRDTDNEILVNQTDFTSSLRRAGCSTPS